MEHAGFQHQALIYEGADEYVAGTAPFLRAALKAGQPALVAVRKEQADLSRAIRLPSSRSGGTSSTRTRVDRSAG